MHSLYFQLLRIYAIAGIFTVSMISLVMAAPRSNVSTWYRFDDNCIVDELFKQSFCEELYGDALSDQSLASDIQDIISKGTPFFPDQATDLISLYLDYTNVSYSVCCTSYPECTMLPFVVFYFKNTQYVKYMNLISALPGVLSSGSADSELGSLETDSNSVLHYDPTSNPGYPNPYWSYDTLKYQTTCRSKHSTGIAIAVLDCFGGDRFDPEFMNSYFETYKDKNIRTSAGRFPAQLRVHGNLVSFIASKNYSNIHHSESMTEGAVVFPFQIANCDLVYDVSMTMAILRAARMGIDIINISASDPEPCQLVEDAIRVATEQYGCLVVCSAGNTGIHGDLFLRKYPASYDDDLVLSVSAMALKDGEHVRAEFGNKCLEVDFAAPGDDVLVFDKYMVDGVSFAVPFISAAAAVVWAEHPDWDRNKVVQCLWESGESVAGFDHDVRRVRLNEALKWGESH